MANDVNTVSKPDELPRVAVRCPDCNVVGYLPFIEERQRVRCHNCKKISYIETWTYVRAFSRNVT